MVQKLRRPVSEVCHRFDPLPQILKNVRYKSGKPLEDPDVKSAISDGEKRLNGHGRLLIRSSGTEPVIRVMGEGEDRLLVEDVVDHHRLRARTGGGLRRSRYAKYVSCLDGAQRNPGMRADIDVPDYASLHPGYEIPTLMGGARQRRASRTKHGVPPRSEPGHCAFQRSTIGGWIGCRHRK